MLYTSYFGKIKKLPKNVYPISIAFSSPTWFTNGRIVELMPPGNLLRDYKNGLINEDEYTKIYTEKVLDKLNPSDIIHEIVYTNKAEIADKLKDSGAEIWSNPDIHAALCCYEKVGDFCHRTLVAKWLTEAGFPCTEWEG